MGVFAKFLLQQIAESDNEDWTLTLNIYEVNG